MFSHGRRFRFIVPVDVWNLYQRNNRLKLSHCNTTTVNKQWQTTTTGVEKLFGSWLAEHYMTTALIYLEPAGLEKSFIWSRHKTTVKKTLFKPAGMLGMESNQQDESKLAAEKVSLLGYKQKICKYLLAWLQLTREIALPWHYWIALSIFWGNRFPVLSLMVTFIKV